MNIKYPIPLKSSSRFRLKKKMVLFFFINRYIKACKIRFL